MIFALTLGIKQKSDLFLIIDFKIDYFIN